MGDTPVKSTSRAKALKAIKEAQAAKAAKAAKAGKAPIQPPRKPGYAAPVIPSKRPLSPGHSSDDFTIRLTDDHEKEYYSSVLMPLHNDALIEKESELLASLGDVTKRLKQVKEEIKLEKAAHLFHNEILGLFQLIGNDADDVRSTIEEVITNIAKAAQLVSGTAAQKVIKSI